MKGRPYIGLLALLLAGLTFSQGSPFQQRLQQAIQSGGSKFAESMKQDPDQALCSQYRDKIPAELVGAFLERQRALIKYPADGKLMGDWKKGEELFTNPRKGNCYACHTGDPREAGAGTMGPGLVNYGQRGTSEAVVKYTYDKIYNAWASMPCSLMYRAGYHGILTPEEAAHVTAFLLDPASPVNAKR